MVTVEQIRQAETRKADAWDEWHDLVEKYTKENAAVPEGHFCKVVCKRGDKIIKAKAYVTRNYLYEINNEYVVRPNLFRARPIKKTKDDNDGPHYLRIYWEGRPSQIVYDDIISIEPIELKTQVCGKCGWLAGRVQKDGHTRFYCRINEGYPCLCGEGEACDRFSWWNWELSQGITHLQYIKKNLANGDKVCL